MKKFIIAILVFVVLLTAIVSCSPERKIAKEFVGKGNQQYALVLGPSFIYKNNLKGKLPDTLSPEKKKELLETLDTVPIIFDKLDDSMFIANYLLGLEKELAIFGFHVFRENQTSGFMEIDSNAFIVNLAQIELEEKWYVNNDALDLGSVVYYHNHWLNAASVNSWIEVGAINSGDGNQHVYYVTDMITDDFNGQFSYDYFSEEVKYLYEQDTLNYNDMYDFAYLLGRTYAGYTFDLLMNRYIKTHVPEKKLSGKYWRYNPELKNYFYAEDDRLIPLEE